MQLVVEKRSLHNLSALMTAFYVCLQDMKSPSQQESCCLKVSKQKYVVLFQEWHLNFMKFRIFIFSRAIRETVNAFLR